ncbi:hypothetical protein FA15DRAFT_575117, partial [Coprinopsis marcescibilis]
TQVCEQLNAWLGGYASILKPITATNFNWTVHVMLYYHTQTILAKQEAKEKGEKGKNDKDKKDNL